MNVKANNVALILDLLILLTERQVKLQNLLRGAQSEGRDVTDEELNALRAEDDAASKELDEAIARRIDAGG